MSRALAEGHTVTVVARDPVKLGERRLQVTVVNGSAMEPALIDQAVQGADAVISTWVHSVGNPPGMMTEAIRIVIASMGKHGVRRIVVLVKPSVASLATPRL